MCLVEEGSWGPCTLFLSMRKAKCSMILFHGNLQLFVSDLSFIFQKSKRNQVIFFLKKKQFFSLFFPLVQ